MFVLRTLFCSSLEHLVGFISERLAQLPALDLE
jgi:hypothetical protein